MDDLIFIKSNELLIQPEKKWFDNKVKFLFKTLKIEIILNINM